VYAVLNSTHGAPRAQPFVKVGAHAPVPDGVGATAMEQSLLIVNGAYDFQAKEKAH